MRLFVSFALLAVIFATVATAYAASDLEQNQLEALLDVDTQGHENVGDREARQFYGRGFGGYGGYPGGFRGGYGGFGGYPGFGGGGFRGGYGGYRGGFGGYRGGFYG